MANRSDNNIINLMWAAVASRRGIVIQTDSVTGFKQKFYSLRQRMRAKGFEDFDNLSCIISPTNPDTEIFLIKEAPDGEIEGETSEA